MKVLRRSGQRVRIATIVFIVPILIATGLRAGEIHNAAAAGDLDKVKTLLEADPKLLETKDQSGATPLHCACSARQMAVANLLIDQGADVNARTRYRFTPLHNACSGPGEDLDLSLIRRLIDQGADVNAQAVDGLTPLHVAVMSDKLKLAKLLAEHGANLDAYGEDCGTPLHSALDAGRKELAKWLVESGAKLNQRYNYGNYELHLAALKGDTELTQFLIGRGSDIHAVNDYGRTALFYAARHGYRKTAEALIAAGAKESAMVETNYGKAPQLDTSLQEGEAYLWYLGGYYGGGYAVKTKGHLLIFDKSGIDESPEAGLANGRLNPGELAGQKITLLVTRILGATFESPAFELARRIQGVDIVTEAKAAVREAANLDIPPHREAAPHESFLIGGIGVHAFPSMARGYGGAKGLGYLVEADGLKILHAGFHAAPGNRASQLERFRKEIDFLKPFGPVDVAILTVSGHLPAAYEPYLTLIDQLAPQAVYLAGGDYVTQEYGKCVNALRARHVPVAYPEGGKAMGERFHYIRDQATPPLPKSDALPLSGDYLGQPPPGATPEVFARGIVSTDDLEHSAPAFTPDGNEVFWWVNRRSGPDKKAYASFGLTMRRENGRWSAPHASPLGGQPVFSADGHRAHFTMVRPRAGTAQENQPSWPDVDIWTAERNDADWSDPKRLDILARYPELRVAGVQSIARNGTLYFMAYTPGPLNDSGIYRAELINGEYAKPELLPRNINLPPFLNWTPSIAPDESYLLFSSNRRDPEHDAGDLYLSRRLTDGSWTEPVNLGETVNTSRQERFPLLSFDGKYLFFTRPTPGHDQDVYWVDASTIPALRSVTHPPQENPK